MAVCACNLLLFLYIYWTDLGIKLLSLSSCSHVVHIFNAGFAMQDPWWNPAVEEQAVMRIHRIGQTKTVTIKRFIIKVICCSCAGRTFVYYKEMDFSTYLLVIVCFT